MVAEKARDAWQAKHKHAHDKLMDRVRKANKQREQQQLPLWIVPPLEDWIAAGFPLESELFPAESADGSGGRIQKGQKRSTGNPLEKALKGEGQGEGYKKEEAAAASLAPARVHEGDPSPPPLDGAKTPEELTLAVAVWLRRKEQARGKQPRGTQGNDPRIAARITASVTGLQLAEAYDLAVLDREATGDQESITPGFLDIFVAKVLNPPQAKSAVNGTRPTVSKSDPLAWLTTASGLEAKGAELGIAQEQGEPFPLFKARVIAAAGLSEDDKARARADLGVHI